MKTILILAPACDRQSAAACLHQALLGEAAGEPLRVLIVDLLGTASRSTARLRAALGDAIRCLQPDVVISTHPIYDTRIGEIYCEGRQRDFVLMGWITHFPAQMEVASWASSRADVIVTASPVMEDRLIDAGIDPGKIKTLAFPLPESSPRDPDVTCRFSSRLPSILYLPEGNRKKAAKLLERLRKEPGWSVTVATDQSWRGQLHNHDVVVARPTSAVTYAAIKAGCPLIAQPPDTEEERGNAALLREANAGAQAEKPRETVAWLKRAFEGSGRLLDLWRGNLKHVRAPENVLNVASFVLEQAEASRSVSRLHLPAAERQAGGSIIPGRFAPSERKLLLCDLHTHTTWSDGRLSVPELVDFYGQRGFDCVCVTDHLCDPKRLLGRLVNLTGLVISPAEIEAYFEEIEREKERAWAQYELLLMAGIEFNKDGYTAKTSAHLLGIDLQRPIDPSLTIEETIEAIQNQGALAVASHPHEIKSEWGKDTLYFWENVEKYSPLLDAWEVANRDDIFNPIGLKKLPFIASSDFHKPKHIHSWKTLLHCEKTSESIKHCVRLNRDVSISLYREGSFAGRESCLPAADRERPEVRLTAG